jgi:hypothetical protein
MTPTQTPSLEQLTGQPSPSPTGLPGPEQLAGLGMPRDPDVTKEPISDRFSTFIRSKWEDWRTAYTVFHQLCWQNVLYYAGQLWILWDRDRRLWYPAVPEDEYTPQPNINDFSPAIDSITSVFRIPVVEATPRNSDDMDSHEICDIATRLAEEFAKRNGLIEGGHTAENDGVGDKGGQLFSLMGNLFTIVRKEKCGIGFRPQFETVPMVAVRCPDCGLDDKLPPNDPRLQAPPSAMLMGHQVNPTPCPQCGGKHVAFQSTTDTRPKINPLNGKPMTDPVIRWTAKCTVGNPLFALPRPGSTGMRGDSPAGYIGWAERMSLDEIYRIWGFEAKPDNQYLDSMESSWEISMNYFFTGYSTLTLATKESALVLRVFIEPDTVKDIPEGGVAVYVNEQIIKVETWDEACGFGHQLTHIGYVSMPTTFFYRTPAFDMAQVQKELLRYESLIALHSMTSASDSLVVDENTKVSNVTGRGDRIIYWRSIGPGSREPHRLQHGSLDNGIYEQRQRLRDSLQQISGAVAVWRGQQTGSVTSAAGISQLRGQAEQMFSKPVSNWNSGWVTTFAKGVKLFQSILEPWEIAEIVGPGRDVQIMKFKQANLDNICDWRASQHGLPKTRDEKRNDLLSLHDRGMLDLTDPTVQQNIHELFGETGAADEFNLDATRARWENDMLAKGQPIQFMPDVEDLQVHLNIHGKRIKRLDFNAFPSEVQQAFIEHYAETKMALTQLMKINAESQVELKAASIGKAAPIQPTPGTLFEGEGGTGGGPNGGGQGGQQPPNPAAPPGPAAGKGNRGGRIDGGPHKLTRNRPTPAGQSVVPTGPPRQK